MKDLQIVQNSYNQSCAETVGLEYDTHMDEEKTIWEAEQYEKRRSNRRRGKKEEYTKLRRDLQGAGAPKKEDESGSTLHQPTPILQDRIRCVIMGTRTSRTSIGYVET